MLIENFAALLSAKPVGKDRWRAVCPCHDDTRPSLDISRGRVQPIMVICRVCDARAPEVAQALGLKVGDLCHDRPLNRHFTRGSRHAERPSFDPVHAAEHIRLEAMVLALLAEKVKLGQALTEAEHKRLDFTLRRCDMITTQAGGGTEPSELARLRGRKAAA